MNRLLFLCSLAAERRSGAQSGYRAKHHHRGRMRTGAAPTRGGIIGKRAASTRSRCCRQ